MSERSEPAPSFDEATAAALALRIETYAAALAEREQRILLALLAASMHPVDRLRLMPASGVLSEREEEFLRTLEARPAGAGAAS